MTLPLDQIILGDALEILKTLPEESVDCIVTDPPYQLSSTCKTRPDQTKEGNYGREVLFSRQQSRIKGFMGKEWDVLPSTEVWKECLRVLKSGAFAFILSTPRLDSLSQTTVRLSEAGFNVGFTPIFWAYGSGFPKSESISLQIDKRACREELRSKLGREPTKEEFNEAWKTFRKVVAVDQTVLARNPMSLHAQDYGGYADGEIAARITEPRTEQAKALDGSFGGFQPKPAVEVIIVAMKPLSEKSFVDQALANHKGVTWLDKARIPIEQNEKIIPFQYKTRPEGYGYKDRTDADREINNKGRFPANLLVSSDALNDGAIQRSTGHFGRTPHAKGTLYEGGFTPNYHRENESFLNDEGSFSRYFDLDRWFEAKLKELPESVRRVFPFLIVSKASKQERNKGLEKSPKQFVTEQNKWSENDYRKGSDEKTTKPRGNFHPTVKPIKLMSYLVTLGSRPNDVVLDPFVGSGTTAIAARLLNRHYIGIDNNAEYVEIARRRVAVIPKRLDEVLS